MTRLVVGLVLVLVVVGIDEWGPVPVLAAPAAKPGVTGSVTIAGALNGKFTWNDSLAIDHCVWEPSIQGGNFEITMTDGAGTFISLRAIATRERQSVRLLSGKLGGDSLEGTGGVTLTGSKDGKRLSVTLDTPVKKGAKAASVKGKLELVCP